jgi:hypothetical protein
MSTFFPCQWLTWPAKCGYFTTSPLMLSPSVWLCLAFLFRSACSSLASQLFRIACRDSDLFSSAEHWRTCSPWGVHLRLRGGRRSDPRSVPIRNALDALDHPSDSSSSDVDVSLCSTATSANPDLGAQYDGSVDRPREEAGMAEARSGTSPPRREIHETASSQGSIPVRNDTNFTLVFETVPVQVMAVRFCSAVCCYCV